MEAGVGGKSLRALPPTSCHQVLMAARRAVSEWTGDRSSGRLRPFPFTEVLAHLQSVGRSRIDPELRAELMVACSHAWSGSGLLREWLPMALEQDGADYDSYVGNAVLVAASVPEGGTPSEQSVDAILVAATADLVMLEAEALIAHPSAAQSLRLRSSVRVLTLVRELAPGFALPSRLIDEPSVLLDRWARLDDVAAAHASYRCAVTVSGQVPSVVREAIDITLLPTTRVHDEQMFVRCIQIFETLYRQVADRIARSIIALDTGDTGHTVTLLTDAARRVRATRVLYRVLTTMPPDAFAVIRAHTHGRSAVQSRPYRRVENLSAPRLAGDSRPLTSAEDQCGTTLQEALLLREKELGREATTSVRRTMSELDSAWRAMKRSHWGVTLKTIGKVPGTGGTAGADYLRLTAQRPLFPLLSTPA
ncbi:hypothetical protein [Nocardiopsis alba]|uniref:hypothetical protein n=1 Tax=Nocardiopsis alba TaxID=53437 RepID=UPI0035D56463